MSKQNIENKKGKRIIIVVASLVALIGITVAWFTVTYGPINQLFGISNFESRAKIYFVGNESNPSYDSEVPLSTNPEADNYIGKFRLDIEHRGSAQAYLRVKLLHDFQINDFSTQYSAKVPYIFASEYGPEADGDKAVWFDNRNVDLSCYYAMPIKGNNDTYTTIPMISGIDEDELEADSLIDDYGNPIEITLVVEMQMVQSNRYPQLWDMDILPWNDVTNYAP